MPPKPLNGMSVDVEEWFQVGAFERVEAPAYLRPTFLAFAK